MNNSGFTNNDDDNQRSAALTEAAKQNWQSAENFYRERDNRTALQIENLEFYAARPIEIWLDPLSSDAAAMQEIALLISNLTARWARHIVVRLSAGVNLAKNLRRDGFYLLADRILSQMQAADPFGDFSVADYDSPVAADKQNPLRIFIGAWSDASVVKPAIAAEDYFIDASGWSVFGRRGGGFNQVIQQDASVPTTALAASLGAADLFKRAVGHAREEWMPDNFVWNVWEQKFNDVEIVVSAARNRQNDQYPIRRNLDVGRTLLAGVGAIGSALIYLMDFMKLSGEMVFLDLDRVETSNLNRSPLFDVRHVIESREKTRIALDYLSCHNIKLSERRGTWHEHAGQVASETFDQWISLTNEDGAWAIVPYLLPPVVLHGTTTSGWGFGAGRHLPRREDCTLCRMPRPEIKFRAVCAQGEISNRDDANAQTATASLPFLSAASAALLLAETIKLSETLNHSQFAETIATGNNEIAADLRFGLFAVTSLKRVRREECRGCRASASGKWLELGGRSRYRYLSEVEAKERLELKAA